MWLGKFLPSFGSHVREHTFFLKWWTKYRWFLFVFAFFLLKPFEMCLFCPIRSRTGWGRLHSSYWGLYTYVRRCVVRTLKSAIFILETSWLTVNINFSLLYFSRSPFPFLRTWACWNVRRKGISVRCCPYLNDTRFRFAKKAHGKSQPRRVLRSFW